MSNAGVNEYAKLYCGISPRDHSVTNRLFSLTDALPHLTWGLQRGGFGLALGHGLLSTGLDLLGRLFGGSSDGTNDECEVDVESVEDDHRRSHNPRANPRNDVPATASARLPPGPRTTSRRSRPTLPRTVYPAGRRCRLAHTQPPHSPASRTDFGGK